MYSVELYPRFEKDISKVKSDIKNVFLGFIYDYLPNFSNAPMHPKVTKMVNQENRYRFKYTDYRLLFEVLQEQNRIKIIEFGHRKDVYK